MPNVRTRDCMVDSDPLPVPADGEVYVRGAEYIADDVRDRLDGAEVVLALHVREKAAVALEVRIGRHVLVDPVLVPVRLVRVALPDLERRTSPANRNAAVRPKYQAVRIDGSQSGNAHQMAAATQAARGSPVPSGGRQANRVSPTSQQTNTSRSRSSTGASPSTGSTRACSPRHHGRATHHPPPPNRSVTGAPAQGWRQAAPPPRGRSWRPCRRTAGREDRRPAPPR